MVKFYKLKFGKRQLPGFLTMTCQGDILLILGSQFSHLLHLICSDVKLKAENQPSWYDSDPSRKLHAGSKAGHLRSPEASAGGPPRTYVLAFENSCIFSIN
jgi:hypothetical protein